MCEQVHASVVGVVHVVLNHVLGATRHAAQRATVVGAVRVGGVVHEVRRAAAAVAPNVAQVQPVTHLVGGRASQIERTLSGTRVACGRVIAHDSVGGCRSAGELSVAEQAAAQVAHPKIQVFRSRPGVRTTLRGEFHGIVGAKCAHCGWHTQDAVGLVALGILGRQAKFNLRVGRLGPSGVLVGIQPTEIFIQNVQLRLDLRVADVLRFVCIEHVEHHRDGHHHLRLCAVGAGLLELTHKLLRVALDQGHVPLHLGMLLHQTVQVAHGVTDAHGLLFWRFDFRLRRALCNSGDGEKGQHHCTQS